MRLSAAEFPKIRALAVGCARRLKHQGIINRKAVVQDDARYIHPRHGLDQFLRRQSRDAMIDAADDAMSSAASIKNYCSGTFGIRA